MMEIDYEKAVEYLLKKRCKREILRGSPSHYTHPDKIVKTAFPAWLDEKGLLK